MTLHTRPVCRRPSGHEDLPAVYAGLSDRSRFLRFHTGVPHVPDSWWPRLARVEPGRVDTAVAWVGPLPVGHGQWHLTDAATAELSLAVADEWQERGVGTALVDHLAGSAAGAGIARFTCWVHPDNGAVRAMLRTRGGHPDGADGAWVLDLDASGRLVAREAA